MSAEVGAAFDAFVSKWRLSAGAERANKDSFLNDLCAVLRVPAPDPTTGNAKRDDYVFEKAVVVAGESGKTTKFIDLYKRGSFVLEAKQGSESNTGKLGTAKRATPTWNVAMNAAFGQAIGYATALDEPPPFIIVADIGYCFDVYASFDGTARYRPFPNALEHRLYLTRIADWAETLQKIFEIPLSLDPSKVAVEVTRDVATRLAHLTRRLEKAGHAPQSVADFLMRCIFTMFAEDVGLLPGEVFTKALRDLWIQSPRSFPGGVETLWRAMNDGSAFGFFGKLLHFNGGLFKSPAALPLEKEDLEVLFGAAACRWNKVEPAILGTLFEGALDKRERHNLGAHFTPRAYVERLVRPTIEEPIRDDWRQTQAKIRSLASSNKINDAKAETRAFLKRLSKVRVLDPACGSGNFLYVALDLLKAIEDEAFAMLLALEGGQTELCLDAPEVTPKQFLGIEVNPRAKAIAELVLWIGYLQWHFRTKHRGGKPREPILEDYKNIENRDAVLAYDSEELVRDETNGKPQSRWDGRTMKLHPATGELVPDDRFQTLLYRYSGVRRAEWPAADYIVGNPPFLGSKRMREAMGDGYVTSLREAHADVPDGTDFVLYWWVRAAQLLRSSRIKRFGFITTNSFTQALNRKATEAALFDHADHAVIWAIADHPWVDSTSGAAVRISMTVGGAATGVAQLLTVVSETSKSEHEMEVALAQTTVARLGSDLRAGESVAAVGPLRANEGLCSVALVRFGEGFVVTREQAQSLEPAVVHPLLTGRDLNQGQPSDLVIDLFPLSEQDAMAQAPRAFQHLLTHVKPARDQIRDPSSRQRWWRFGRDKPELRRVLASIPRYIATSEVSKHRIFSFVPSNVRPDHTLVVVASDDAFVLGVLSSRAHVAWALAAGGTLEDRPRYNRSVCFDPFPFPVCGESARVAIRTVGEQIDAHRKNRLGSHPDLSLTAIYNVLEKVRSGQPLTIKEHAIHEQGLVSLLLKLHEDLDAAVLSAYGWPANISHDQIVDNLARLNATRLQQEQQGEVQWLRPELQRTVAAGTAEAAGEEPSRPGLRKSKPPKGPGVAVARRPRPAKPKRKA